MYSILLKIKQVQCECEYHITEDKIIEIEQIKNRVFKKCNLLLKYKKINENLYQLRKVLYEDSLNNITKVEQFNWR